MAFGSYLVLLLIIYSCYYLIIFLPEFIRNRENITTVGGISPHAVSFKVKQQPVVVTNAGQDGSENQNTEKNKEAIAKKSRPSVVADLGLEILSNGIDISAENLSLLLS